ncbi:uncharacterized protein [Antedon mediterranea]|uniref:uncharacterized protein n=1 Tax=Antedon mediterranea TaxID=105859 RepID=UPI003AF87A84
MDPLEEFLHPINLNEVTPGTIDTSIVSDTSIVVVAISAVVFALIGIMVCVLGLLLFRMRNVYCRSEPKIEEECHGLRNEGPVPISDDVISVSDPPDGHDHLEWWHFDDHHASEIHTSLFYVDMGGSNVGQAEYIDMSNVDFAPDAAVKQNPIGTTYDSTTQECENYAIE